MSETIEDIYLKDEKDLDDFLMIMEDTSKKDFWFEINAEDTKKLYKEIKELNIKILSNAGIYQLGFNDGKETINNKIKVKIEELEKIHKNQDWTQKQGFYYDCLQELLEEE